jgi:hypothetical protein
MEEKSNLTKAELIEKVDILEDTLNANKETLKHIEKVREFLGMVIEILIDRSDKHDKSKLEEPENEYFAKVTSKLSGTTYGSEEYNKYLEELKPALEHHYSKNKHHPEHFPNGIDDMSLLDILEMVCDWKASSMRHHDGNILKSIEINSKRFKIDKQLANILKNTVELFEHIDY